MFLRAQSHLQASLDGPESSCDLERRLFSQHSMIRERKVIFSGQTKRNNKNVLPFLSLSLVLSTPFFPVGIFSQQNGQKGHVEKTRTMPNVSAQQGWISAHSSCADSTFEGKALQSYDRLIDTLGTAFSPKVLSTSHARMWILILSRGPIESAPIRKPFFVPHCVPLEMKG